MPKQRVDLVDLGAAGVGVRNGPSFSSLSAETCSTSSIWSKVEPPVEGALVKTYHDWADDMMQRYTGPILFLTVKVTFACTLQMLYMDRLVIGSRVILRSIPAFTGWTTRAMKDREFKEIRDGGFGLGTIDTPLREPTIVKEPDSVGQSSEFCAGQVWSFITYVCAFFTIVVEV
nr:uncharacterized protein LOC109174777 [Ipomoea batatas]